MKVASVCALLTLLAVAFAANAKDFMDSGTLDTENVLDSTKAESYQLLTALAYPGNDEAHPPVIAIKVDMYDAGSMPIDFDATLLNVTAFRYNNPTSGKLYYDEVACKDDAGNYFVLGQEGCDITVVTSEMTSIAATHASEQNYAIYYLPIADYSQSYFIEFRAADGAGEVRVQFHTLDGTTNHPFVDTLVPTTNTEAADHLARVDGIWAGTAQVEAQDEPAMNLYTHSLLTVSDITLQKELTAGDPFFLQETTGTTWSFDKEFPIFVGLGKMGAAHQNFVKPVGSTKVCTNYTVTMAPDGTTAVGVGDCFLQFSSDLTDISVDDELVLFVGTVAHWGFLKAKWDTNIGGATFRLRLADITIDHPESMTYLFGYEVETAPAGSYNTPGKPISGTSFSVATMFFEYLSYNRVRYIVPDASVITGFSFATPDDSVGVTEPVAATLKSYHEDSTDFPVDAPLYSLLASDSVLARLAKVYRATGVQFDSNGVNRVAPAFELGGTTRLFFAGKYSVPVMVHSWLKSSSCLISTTPSLDFTDLGKSKYRLYLETVAEGEPVATSEVTLSGSLAFRTSASLPLSLVATLDTSADHDEGAVATVTAAATVDFTAPCANTTAELCFRPVTAKIDIPRSHRATYKLKLSGDSAVVPQGVRTVVLVKKPDEGLSVAAWVGIGFVAVIVIAMIVVGIVHFIFSSATATGALDAVRQRDRELNERKYGSEVKPNSM